MPVSRENFIQPKELLFMFSPGEPIYMYALQKYGEAAAAEACSMAESFAL